MKVKNIEIKEIKVVKTDSKTGNMQVQISFIGETPISTTLSIHDSYENMAEHLINEVKRQKKPVDDDDDDLLGGIGIINISNDDDLREKIGRGIVRLEQRFDTLKRTRSATEYMKVYTQFSTSEDIIYKK